MTTENKLELALNALQQITLVAGNLPDSALITTTGPNDARHRGILLTNARAIAKITLEKITFDPHKKQEVLNSKWQWMDNTHGGMGWFSDEEKTKHENSGVFANGWWRPIPDEELASMNRVIGQLAYEQA